MFKWVSLYLIKTQFHFTSNVLNQNSPKSKYESKNELIYRKPSIKPPLETYFFQALLRGAYSI